MPKVSRTANQQLPSEYRLPTVQQGTIEQLEPTSSGFNDSLQEFTETNIELATWLRVEATRRFPDSLSERKKAIGLALAALRLVQNQQVIDILTRHFALDAEPIPVSTGESDVILLPPAA